MHWISNTEFAIEINNADLYNEHLGYLFASGLNPKYLFATSKSAKNKS